ncbi:hypothetical protein BHE74_00026511 [Ensete ventricosum]|uniref:Uncharacterized protein n=1 Tax=Ensete ventricosum TaxID=4639 RepID=A0A444EVR2_ENSVE|nr:hypothetical protein B296_00027140 [Ensete ventricosum]RWW14457.1 hypothetical protein GW17_00021775 [Ensete ventricosum]RWW66143.1 hypothetical protein BHE74_00026511 [Ensete ventricosum]
MFIATGVLCLFQVTSKHYSIAVLKDHYKFSRLENYLVRYFQHFHGNTVTLSHVPENVKSQRKLIDENGSFCFEVPSLSSDIQAQVNVHGNVFCKEKCSPNLSVSLVRVIGESVQERKTIALTHESCEFTFMKVFPGKYRLEACNS